MCTGLQGPSPGYMADGGMHASRELCMHARPWPAMAEERVDTRTSPVVVKPGLGTQDSRGVARDGQPRAPADRGGQIQDEFG